MRGGDFINTIGPLKLLSSRDQPNLFIEFNCPITLNKSFGQDLEVSAITHFLDEPSKMIQAIKEKQLSKIT